MYGTPGMNSTKPLESAPAETYIAEDGERMIKPGHMYRMNEHHPGRRQPDSPHLHNLDPGVFERTIMPSFNLVGPGPKRREQIWDRVCDAMTEALAGMEPGTHVVVCGNSGPFAAKVEAHPPSAFVRGATAGVLLVAEFRPEGVPIHKDWCQIAVPVRPDEGRLLAGLRLVPTVLNRFDLSYTVVNVNTMSVSFELRSFIKDHTNLPYGSCANSWVPTNLGCWFHRGGLFYAERGTIKASFAWDGDLYGWDEAVLYTRKPIAIISYTKPDRRFDHWSLQTVRKDVNWLQVVDGQLTGGLQKTARRADVIDWDRNGIPKAGVQVYSERDASNRVVDTQLSHQATHRVPVAHHAGGMRLMVN